MKRLVTVVVFLASTIFVLSQPGFASDIPGIRTPIPINLLSNGDFETGNVDGWKFGNINRGVHSGGAQNGTYWLDTTNCGNCPSDFGNEKTIVYDITGNFNAGQKYSVSAYFRSHQGGEVRLAFWQLGNTAELLGIFDKVGSGNWQKLEINNVGLRFSGNQTLRVQIYINNIADGIHYQFDNFVLTPLWNCPTGYYTYQQPLKPDAPILADLFNGKAHFQTFQESQKVNLYFDSSMIKTEYGNGLPSKLPILFNQDDGKYYAYTRAYVRDKGFNIFLMSSTDGVNFTQVAPIFDLDESIAQGIGELYDPHIAIDYSVCPPKYTMALECSGSMCASSSISPFNPSSWSKPIFVVSYNDNKSASTGVFLIDGNNKYASWTVIDDGPLGMNKDHDTGIESAYTRGIAATNLLSYLGHSSIGNVLLPAEPNTHCTSSWDCNNRDAQDWKKEGNYYYLMYNGANYYRCFRFPGDNATNDWGIGIVRSTGPLGGYDLNGVGKIIDSPINNVCDIAYPVINAIGGELYMYYLAGAMGNEWVARSKLVWNVTSINLSSGWNEIIWLDVSGYNAPSALADIDSDCGAGTAVAIARKRQDWWEGYVKNYGGKNFGLQNSQSYLIKVSAGCNWIP